MSDKRISQLTEKSTFGGSDYMVTDNAGEAASKKVKATFITDQFSDMQNVLGAKNLLRYPYFNKSFTSGGVTFTDNGDGSVTVSGTATERLVFVLESSSSNFILPSGEYKALVSGNTAELSFVVDAYNGSSWIKNLVTFTESSSAFEIDYDGYDRIQVYFYVASGKAVTPAITLKPMIIPSSVKDDSYEEYSASNKELTEISRQISKYGVSSTSAATAAKAATTLESDFVLEEGNKVFVKFTNNNTAASPTLNVDGTGAKSIVGYGSTTPSSWWSAGDIVEFVYDGTNYVMQPTQGQIAELNSHLTQSDSKLSKLFETKIVAIPAKGASIGANATTVLDLYNLTTLLNQGYTFQYFVPTTVQNDYIFISYRVNSNIIRISAFNSYSSAQSCNIGGHAVFTKSL